MEMVVVLVVVVVVVVVVGSGGGGGGGSLESLIHLLHFFLKDGRLSSSLMFSGSKFHCSTVLCLKFLWVDCNLAGAVCRELSGRICILELRWRGILLLTTDHMLTREWYLTSSGTLHQPASSMSLFELVLLPYPVTYMAVLFRIIWIFLR